MGRTLATATIAAILPFWVLAGTPQPARAQGAENWITNLTRGLAGSQQRSKRRRQQAASSSIDPPPLPARRPRYEVLDGHYRIVRDAPDTPPRSPDESSTPPPSAAGTPVPRVEPIVTEQAPPPPQRKPADAPQEGWDQQEIDTALRECVDIVKRYQALALPEPPIREGTCGTPAPVTLRAIYSGPQKVEFDPPVTVNCRMVAAIGDWLNSDLQPLSKKFLKSRIVRIGTMSSYSCRNVYGRVSTRLSEHGFANALDIRDFVTEKGSRADLLGDWGTTARDERKRLIAEQARAELEAKKLKELKSKGPGAKEQLGKSAPSKQPQTGAADTKAAAITHAPPPTAIDLENVVSPAPTTPAGRFLRAAHETACGHFGTVLGPEANEAHRNHFHVDLAPRKKSNYCR